MKYFFLGVILFTSLFPQYTKAVTIEDEYHAILKQTIAVLEMRIKQLKQPVVSSGPLQVPQVAVLTAGTMTKRKLTSGGGRSPRPPVVVPPVPPTPTFSIEGNDNTATIVSNVALVPETLVLTLNDFSDDVTLPLPAPLRLAAFLTEGGYLEVEFVPEGDGTVFVATLADLLTPGQSYSGVFTVLIPEEITGEYLTYSLEYQGNATTLTTTLVNSGTAELTLLASNDNPAPATIMVERNEATLAVPVLAFGLNSVGGGRVTLDQLVMDVQSEPEVLVGEVIGAARLVGAGESFSATITSTALVFADLAFLLERDLAYTFVLEVDLLPQAENYNFSQLLTFGLEVASVQAYLAGQSEPIGSVAGEAVYSNEQVLLPRSIFIPADTFLPNFVTLNDSGTEVEFTLDFTVGALYSDFYLKSEGAQVSENPSSGVGFIIDGDYGTGTVSATLTSSAEEDTPGVFVVHADETETFILTVAMTTSATADFRITLAEAWSSLISDGETDTDRYELAPAADFTTQAETIVGS